MQRILVLSVLLSMFWFGSDSQMSTSHPDYVPDAKTAEQIAEAVLIGQFGEARVAAQLPLHAASMTKDVWLVGGALKGKDGGPQVGGGFGVCE